MSFNPRTDSSSPPGHQDLVDSLAAPAQVDQVGGTQMQRLRMTALRKLAHRYAVELIFFQVAAVALNVAAAVLSFTKLLGVCA